MEKSSKPVRDVIELARIPTVHSVLDDVVGGVSALVDVWRIEEDVFYPDSAEVVSGIWLVYLLNYSK